MEAFLGQIAQMLVARADQGKKEGGAFKVGGWFYTCLVPDCYRYDRQVYMV